MSYCEGYSMVGTSGINGDAYYISPDKTTFLLADGASGAGSEGKVLMSNLCVEVVKNNPFSLSELSPKDYLVKLIWVINNKLIAISQEQKHYIFGTVIICVVKDHIGTIVAIGDSPAFLIHGNTITRVAETKKAYYNLVEMGLYTEQQLEQAVHKLPEHMWSMFDRFIPMVVPTYAIEEIELQKTDMIVFCCDGVSDYVQSDDIKDVLSGENLLESIKAVIHTAQENSIRERNCVRYDDLTMVVYRCCDYITTYTKVHFTPLCPQKEDIRIEDIAHALSMMTRANGHFPEFYSVGQHCLACADEARARNAGAYLELACLLHDAAESYLADVTRPVKQHMDFFKQTEEKLLDLIYERFLGRVPDAEERAFIKNVDDTLLYHEFYHYMGEKLFEEPMRMFSAPRFVTCAFAETEQRYKERYLELAAHHGHR